MESSRIKVSDTDDKLGVMLVGLCGNNGSTLAATLLALQHDLTWIDEKGEHEIDLLGSLYGYGSITSPKGQPHLIRDLVPLISPCNIVFTGWDIKSKDLYSSCVENKVLPYSIREQLKEELSGITPMPSVYEMDFIARNQTIFADNMKLEESKWKQMLSILQDIADFRKKHRLKSAPVVLWTASTERMHKGTWKTPNELILAIKTNDPEVSPSILFAVATIISGGIFVNGSPQNTIGDALLQMAKDHNAFAIGEDFKTGQTKLKSVLADFLANSGLRPLSIVSYNHLGNNDGLNLSETPQFNSKEISKRSVIDDVVRENPVLFKWGDSLPDHLVRIDYVPAVGDSKRAMDEYHSELLFNGRSNIAIHNVCEDTLLAVPVMLDIIIFSDFFRRVTVNGRNFNPEMSLMAYFFKAPVHTSDSVSVNAFFPQLMAIKNFVRMCSGWPLPDFVELEGRLASEPWL